MQIFDQNAHRIAGKVPAIKTVATVEEGVEYIKKLHPFKKVTHSSTPDDSPGALVWVDDDYAYSIC